MDLYILLVLSLVGYVCVGFVFYHVGVVRERSWIVREREKRAKSSEEITKEI